MKSLRLKFSKTHNYILLDFLSLSTFNWGLVAMHVNNLLEKERQLHVILVCQSFMQNVTLLTMLNLSIQNNTATDTNVLSATIVSFLLRK